MKKNESCRYARMYVLESASQILLHECRVVDVSDIINFIGLIGLDHTRKGAGSRDRKFKLLFAPQIGRGCQLPPALLHVLEQDSSLEPGSYGS